MINVSVKINAKNALEFRVDYMFAEPLFFEKNPDLLNLEELSLKPGSLTELIKKTTTPTNQSFAGDLANKRIVLGEDETIHYSLLDKNNKPIEGTMKFSESLHFPRQGSRQDDNSLESHLSGVISHIASRHYHAAYFKSLPLLVAKGFKGERLPVREFQASAFSDVKWRHSAQPATTPVQTYCRIADLYEVPADNPQLALRLIVFFQTYVALRVHQIKKNSIDDYIKDGVCESKVAIERLFNNTRPNPPGTMNDSASFLRLHFKHRHAFIEDVLAKLETLPSYALLYRGLKAVYRYAEDCFCMLENMDYPESLSDIVFNEAWAKLVLQFGSPGFLYDTNLPLAERQARFEAMTAAYREADRLDELKQLIKLNNSVAITDFLKEKTNHKKAVCGTDITWKANDDSDLTEVRFLSGSVFSLNNGRIRVLQHNDNPFYTHYKQGKNATTLTPELTFLFNEVLECPAETGDFHQGIVFTEAASERLMSRGVHFNAGYIDALLAKWLQKPLPEKTASEPHRLTDEDLKRIARISSLGLYAPSKTLTGSRVTPVESEEHETRKRSCCKLL